MSLGYGVGVGTLKLIESVAADERLITLGQVRMSEIISAMSVALDITEGQLPGHAARSCLIGMRLARELCLNDDDRSALFYALLLKDLGCSSNAAKMCWLFGADDRMIKRDLKLVNWTKARECFQFSWKRAADGRSTVQKVLQMAVMAREGEKGARQLVQTRCERGADIVRMLQLPEATATAVRNLDEHYNGKGHPDGLKGDEIPLLARIACLAQTVEVFLTSYGLVDALEVARARRGQWFDPQLVDALLAVGIDTDFWASVHADNLRDEVDKCEPPDRIMIVDEPAVDRIAAAFARVVDAKSPWTHSHSEGVARIARGIAGELGFSPDQQHDIWRAGLLHDIGKLGVSNMILDKPGRPTDEEFGVIKQHPGFSFQVLNQIDCFQKMADIAASHHERLDGRGYFRGMGGDQLPIEARLLAVADVCEALSAKRPYRDEMPREKVDEIMSSELGTGLCPVSFEALQAWQDKSSVVDRVETQLTEIERLLSEF